MPRIRTIKPEFWTSEQIAECSPNTRLLFIGLWTFSDDGGVHPANAMRAKMEIFPADAFTKSDVEAMIRELIEVGLLQEYEVDGERYWRVSGWKHQKIDQPTYRHPQPDGDIPDSPIKRRTQAERSPSVRRTDADCSILDLDLDLDLEGERKSQKHDARKGALRKPDFLEAQVWNDYRSFRSSKRAKLTPTAWARIEAELRRGIDRQHDPNEMLAVAMEAGWTGFKLEWFENRASGDRAASAQSVAREGPAIPPELEGTDWAREQRKRWHEQRGGTA